MTAWGGRRVQALRAATLRTYGTVCHLCGKDGADTADHVRPRVHGGLDVLENLRPAHGPCNYARGDMPLGRWFQLHPLQTQAQRPPSREW